MHSFKHLAGAGKLTPSRSKDKNHFKKLWKSILQQLPGTNN